MAYIEPNTEIWFCSDVPLDPDYENTLYFESRAAQYNYFSTLVARRFSKNSYQRKSRGWLRIGWNDGEHQGSVIADMYNANYMMFKNTNFENKWFYAFVDRVEYINNNCVEVQYHIDVMQTWHFDYQLNECLIERQHVSNDTPGLHTVPEQLEHGPYICDRPDYRTLTGAIVQGGDFLYQPGIIVATTFDENYDYSPGKIIHGYNLMGNYYSGIHLRTYSTSAQDIDALNDFLEEANESEAKAAGILSIAMIPLSLVSPTGDDYSYNDILFTRNESLGQYTPRNKKLLTNPYNLIYVTNNQGNTAEYYWEDSYNRGYLEFRIWANFSTTPAMMGGPVQYKQLDNQVTDDEILTVNNFPLCAWTNDAFKAWLAQNAGTIAGTAIGLGIGWATTIASSGALSLLTGGGGGSTFGKHLEPEGKHLGSPMYGEGYNDTVSMPSPSGGLLGATLGAVGQLIDHSRRPPQSNGNSNGNLIYQAGLMTFSFYRKYIKPEYAAIIDQYFDMYGYKVNAVGVPNRAVRPCYTYVKTIGCTISGHIPADDTINIQNIFNKGVRFWKPNAAFGIYDPNVNPNSV